ncbi:glycoside hydrolase family 3 N-terminal domain-containing protein [Ostreiculturibacter nitratireducens]|uniref:glycoside hydrolase family 3 N-terminal domain-containing protein n=1 Tax=Ostreiculturibacter nitratireducens TaxID=3075226 RepID=UPI0031B618D2
MDGKVGAGTTAAILGCEGPVLSPDEAAFFRASDPFGFILFARNVENPSQLSRLTSDLREAVGRDAPVLIDQEGGRVQRMRAPHWREWLPPLDQVLASPSGMAARGLWLRYRLIAEELRAVGIDANCAPTADVAGPLTHPFLRNRCFGETAEAVTEAARASADGLLAGGVLPVVKHMPGHGRAQVDSHHQLPTVTADAAELFATDFVPFAALADLPLAMTAHIVFTAFDPDNPATTSPRMVRLIREEIGFKGFLMTDDISMQALAGDIADRAAASIAAGCDAVLHCNGKMAEMEMAVAAAGWLSPDARARAEAALACRRQPDAIDTAHLEAEFERLLKGPCNG